MLQVDEFAAGEVKLQASGSDATGPKAFHSFPGLSRQTSNGKMVFSSS
jgi:hypothetical protein